MKQAIVARTDIGMGQGKIAAQVAHAALSAFEDADAKTRRAWKGEGQKKIVLKGESEAHLFELADAADRAGGRTRRRGRRRPRDRRPLVVLTSQGTGTLSGVSVGSPPGVRTEVYAVGRRTGPHVP